MSDIAINTPKKQFNIEPADGVIIIEPFKEQDTGLITVADEMATKDSAGTVLAIGKPGPNDFGTMFSIKASVGDTVFFKDHNAMMFHKHGKLIKFIRMSDILAIERKPDVN